MGYASRNNMVSKMVKEGKITSLRSLKEQELIRMYPKKAYSLGLITFEKLKFILSQPSTIETVARTLAKS